MNLLPWRRRRGVTQAEQSSSTQALVEARDRETQVAHVVDAANDARRRNHFGERLHKAMEGHS